MMNKKIKIWVALLGVALTAVIVMQLNKKGKA
jgi:hypothetical protein